MLGIAIGVLHLGYWIAYWGVDMITGGNDSFFDVGVPGRWKGPAPKDGPGTGAVGAPVPVQNPNGIGAPPGQLPPGGIVGGGGNQITPQPGQHQIPGDPNSPVLG